VSHDVAQRAYFYEPMKQRGPTNKDVSHAKPCIYKSQSIPSCAGGVYSPKQ
jgi:hypothetical protein